MEKQEVVRLFNFSPSTGILFKVGKDPRYRKAKSTVLFLPVRQTRITGFSACFKTVQDFPASEMRK